MKFPWNKRADDERLLRQEAEQRAAEIENDWKKIRRHRRSIDRDIEMNDWTGAALTIFSGKEPT